jgi:uncharacterized protein YqgV (UPF0045/DUF77 family)
MHVSAQVSLYPLRQPRLTPVIKESLDLLRELGLRVEPGAMSTVIVGEQDVVFAALKEVFGRAAAAGDLVMHVAVSNACPLGYAEETQSGR